MSGTVLLSTHRLPLAGALREAFRGQGYEVDLLSHPDQLAGVSDPVLLILTGEGDAEEWGRAAAEAGENTPLFTSFTGEDGLRRGREFGAVEVFGSDPDPAEVALLGHRLIQRIRLQEVTGIVGETEAIREALERVVQIAPVDATALITGESGTGKELVARGIHALSPRRHRAFLAVNVAALTETLLESELFGHEKGAFTGAIDTRKGFFELADRGTLFLDEIGELPLTTQTKLLRVLEQREFLRVGGERPIRVDVRIITATNQELRTLVAEGRFRSDLFYRLNILGITLPPLRDRKEDIPLLIRHFVREATRRMDRAFPGISPEGMDLLVDYPWPGNVRELRNLVESMVVLAPGRPITPADLPAEITSPGAGRALLPAPILRREETEDEAPVHTGRGLRPELEFVFRTLVELRMDMDQLRKEFDAYRDEASVPPFLLERTPGGVEVGRTPRPFAMEPAPDAGGGVFGGHEEAEEGEGRDPHPPEGVLFRPGMTMDDLEREAIMAVLEAYDGNRRRAAESLGIGERTLYRKLRKYEIDG